MLNCNKFKVGGPTEFEAAFGAMAKERVDAVVINEDGELFSKHEGDCRSLHPCSGYPWQGNDELGLTLEA